jgi:hypothetical protein
MWRASHQARSRALKLAVISPNTAGDGMVAPERA